MNRIEQERRKKIHDIVTIVKVISIFFGLIAIFSHANLDYFNWEDFKKLGFASLFLFVVVFQLWTYYMRNTQVHETVSLKDIVEIALHILIIIAIILYTGAHLSQYKALFFFTVLTVSTQHGMKWGMITSAVTSVCIAVIDITALPLYQKNPYFQSDLILMGIFFMTSWLLGYYIQTENFYRRLLSNLANMDELTGLYNHRYFQQSLTTLLDNAQSSEHSLALLFADLDYFKYYNDFYGHQAGDKVLVDVSRIIEETVGDKGTVSRYGGEEFAVLLPDTSQEAALAAAEEIRTNIESYQFDGAEHQPGGKLTISIGAAIYPHNGRSKSELIGHADEALYRAKFISKNKVEMYFSILDELKEDLDGQYLDLISSIKTLISIINAKDRYTFGHTERVVKYCRLMGDVLKLPEADMRTLQYGAYLHDIGKIEIPTELLVKKEKLSPEEWAILKQHPQMGADIIKPIPSLENVLPLIKHHHERMDGNGYPDRIKGSKNSLLIRILTLADSFDAMTTPRPYQPRKRLSEAIEELQRCIGSQFDGQLVETFIRVIKDHPEEFSMLE